jgi:hypothetical protein
MKRIIKDILKNKKMNRMYTYKSYYEKRGLLDFYTKVFEINKTNGFNDIEITQCFYNIMNNVISPPLCKYCGDSLKFINFAEGYRKVCDKKECYKKNKRSLHEDRYNMYETLKNNYIPKISLNFDRETIKRECYNVFYKNDVLNKTILYIGILLHRGHEDLLNCMYTRTKYLGKNSDVSERLYHIMNDIEERPTCEYCGNELKWKRGRYSMDKKCAILSSADKNRGSKQTPESIKKRIYTRKNNGNKWHSEKTLKKISDSNKRFWGTPGVLEERSKRWKENGVYERQSQTMRNKIEKGEFTPCITNSWYNSKTPINLNGIKYRSGWDAIYHLLNMHMSYEKIRIKYRSPIDDKNHIYIVDFVDYKNKEIIEVKPQSNISNPVVKAKEKYAKEWCNENGYSFRYVNEDYFYTNIDKIRSININNERINNTIKSFERML